jgi:hypothetical protein
MTTADLPRYEDQDATEQPDETPEEQPEVTPKGLRENLSAANARIKDLEAQVVTGEGQLRAESMTTAYQALKLDPNQGIGRAAATLFNGKAEDLAGFVEAEFGYTPAPDAHPLAAQIALGQAQLDQVGDVASAMAAAATRSERLVEARATGNYEREGAIMAAQMDEMMSRQRRGL